MCGQGDDVCLGVPGFIKLKAVNEAINARMNNNTVSSSEIRNIRDEKSKPFEKKAEQARKKFLKAKTMTAEEARATVGVDDATRKEKTKAKKNCQERLNEICRERNMAVHNALNFDKKSCISVREGQARIAKAEKRFLKKMDECRGAVAKYTPLTMEEAKEIVPNVEVDDEGNEITKKSAAQAKKDARTKTFVPPRVVTDEGLPVSRAGMEKFIEINQEIDKRNQDVHGLYIYNDFSGYGVTEVMENLVCQSAFIWPIISRGAHCCKKVDILLIYINSWRSSTSRSSRKTFPHSRNGQLSRASPSTLQWATSGYG